LLYAKDNHPHSIVNIKDMPVAITLLRNVRLQIKSDRIEEELEKIAIAEEYVKIKDRLKALDMLAKHAGLYDKQIRKFPEILKEKEQPQKHQETFTEKDESFKAIARLLDSKSREKVIQALKKRLEQKEAKPKGATETGLGRGSNGENEESDFENSYVTTRSKKTRKSMGSRHVPVPVMVELKRYVSRLDAEQEKIFNDNFSRYRWDKIRQKLGLDDFKFHDLRKTFGSILVQNGVSTAVTQKLLEHSSPDLTNKVYTNVDPVLWHVVDQIPVGDVL